MTPDCCTRAWAKATDTNLELVNPKVRLVHELFWGWRGTKGKVVKAPKPTSAEWLADIVEAGCSPTKIKWHDETAWVAIWEDDEECEPAPDLRRALCAALNGSPCERKP